MHPLKIRLPRPSRRGPRRLAGVLLTTLLCLSLLSPAGCSTNPATGQLQLNVLSRDEEIRLGEDAAPQFLEQGGGEIPDEAIQQYVADLGSGLAAVSERPDLPWAFYTLDSATVNAFALPGGFIYITRGILAYFNSGAELAAVVGHEIAHVTARHSAEQLSRRQLATLGIGIGSVLSEEFAEFRGLAGAGLQVLFLKYGRDDARDVLERDGARARVRLLQRRDGPGPVVGLEAGIGDDHTQAASSSAGVPRTIRPPAKWMPHSSLVWPRQRPARGSSPGATGLVHGAQPSDG